MTAPPSTPLPRTAAYAARLALRELPTPWVTGGLVALNVLVFLATVLGPLLDDDRLLALGALYGPAAFDQPWRLVTAGFLHAGLLHLVVNMVVLWDLGSVLEAAGGARRFLGVYLVALLGASLVSWVAWPLSLSVGASGAVLGLAGDLFVNARALLGDRAAGASLRRSVGMWVALLVGLGFVLPLDNAAHLGGFATGAALGRALPPSCAALRRPARGGALTAAGALAVGAALFAAGCARVQLGARGAARVHQLRGLRLLDAGRPAEAAEQFSQALERSPEPAFLRCRALARYRADDREGFRADLAAAAGATGEEAWVPRHAEVVSELVRLGPLLEAR